MTLTRLVVCNLTWIVLHVHSICLQVSHSIHNDIPQAGELQENTTVLLHTAVYANLFHRAQHTSTSSAATPVLKCMLGNNDMQQLHTIINVSQPPLPVQCSCCTQ